jgi:hypothetical protein
VRRYGWLLALIPLVALAAWLVASQLPTWSVPHAGWFPAAMPGRCAAVASLRANSGTIAAVPALDLEVAQGAAHEAINAAIGGVNWIYSEFTAVRATFGSEARPALLMAARGDSAGIAPAAVVYLDAETAQVLSVSVGLDDPTASCDFNLRRAVRDAVLSPPFLILAGYTALLAAGGIGWLIFRRRARKG